MYVGIILLAAVIVFSVFLSLKRRANSSRDSNRRRRRAPRFTPVEKVQEIDADEVLGLSEKKQVNAKMKTEMEPQYISVSLLATTGKFSGYELLQALLANGLRFGKQKIFHRYASTTGESETLFSLASAAKPGTFDLQKMGGFSTPGLTLFLLLNEVAEPLKAYDTMLETAYQLAEDLNGVLLDEKREPLSRDVISKWRKQVKHFIENQHVGDLFEMAPTA